MSKRSDKAKALMESRSNGKPKGKHSGGHNPRTRRKSDKNTFEYSDVTISFDGTTIEGIRSIEVSFEKIFPSQCKYNLTIDTN